MHQHLKRVLARVDASALRIDAPGPRLLASAASIQTRARGDGGLFAAALAARLPALRVLEMALRPAARACTVCDLPHLQRLHVCGGDLSHYTREKTLVLCRLPRLAAVRSALCRWAPPTRWRRASRLRACRRG